MAKLVAIVVLALMLARADAQKRIEMHVKDFTPAVAAKLHAKVCVHGPTHFCGPLLNKRGELQLQETRIPKDAKPGKYCMWIEYDGGETELRSCFYVSQ